ncbi:MAG: TetR/AcrR family transcriptional regulator [Ruminococcaceae bacterium]|nr:TetR/AcrR family transcriptional regulator [Oscillospiraceae bacterium]
MDRRKRKTREAIFKSFIELLEEEEFNQITVEKIITRADIGRATFYAHFETKDFLLKELLRELFDHIFETQKGENSHSHIFDCDAPDSVFLHLFTHLSNNDNNIRKLLSCRNNELFLGYFKQNLLKLAQNQISLFNKPKELPHSFMINHIASVFTETVRWWIEGNMKESPETITKYFLLAV